MKKYTFLLSFLVLFVSCEKDDIEPTVEDARYDKPVYEFTITGGDEGEVDIVSENPEESIWKSGIGYIFLGTDKVKVNDPIGTLTFNIDSLFTESDGELKAYLKSAMVSKTDQREGTPEQLNGKTYFLSSSPPSGSGYEDPGIITNIIIGNNFISGKFVMFMEGGAAFKETEYVKVVGFFVSVHNYDN